MTEYIPPHKKLHFFVEKIGLTDSDMAILDPYREIFIGKSEVFANYFYDVFYGIEATRSILEGEKEKGLIKRVWSSWFATFFKGELNEQFLSYLWKIGVRHVEVNLDQRFSNLGFSMIRQFCHNIILNEVPKEKQGEVFSVIDKLLDLCVLVETTAYIENSVSCDIEVMREVADRVRNPALVIGLNIKRLHDRSEEDTKEHRIYELIMAENKRLEGMVRDIKVYMDIFQSEPEKTFVDIEEEIASVIKTLKEEGIPGDIKVDIVNECQTKEIKADRVWIRHLFYYLLQNSMEAMGNEKEKEIRITLSKEASHPYYYRIEILDSGIPPQEEEERLFQPFFSTKPKGTGFGLPIARLVVRKHHGNISIKAGEKRGTSVIIRLPSGDG
ncbi:MAG: ATP-binding protein [Syntrophorhabdaceae bacterium]|nr:ATP-binding protein [Syntrophorhabdaceae bacterium]